ncbi:MAG: CGGC domain-containing protein [Desulfovibrio sp.]|jgi:predicted metal-binding protein|nr:CGGC domain-containing protein [Desulfovibrio sp.]
MAPEKVLIVGCQQTMNEICVGCSRCMVAFNRREGEFAAYGPDAELIGLLSCGGCPGQAIVMRLAQMQLWNAPMKETPTHLHVAPCLDLHCPQADIIKKKIVKTAGIPVILGTHPYLPKDIFTA